MAVNAWKTRSQLANKIGKGKYVLAEYEKIKRITMLFDENHILYITTEVSAGHNDNWYRISVQVDQVDLDGKRLQ